MRRPVERGLHRVISDTQRGILFKPWRASFKGKGRQAELSEASWEKLRDVAYNSAVRDPAGFGGALADVVRFARWRPHYWGVGP